MFFRQNFTRKSIFLLPKFPKFRFRMKGAPPEFVSTIRRMIRVEEKFEKYFGYSGRRNFRKIVYIDPTNYKFHRNFENWKTKWDKNSAKIWNFDFSKISIRKMSSKIKIWHPKTMISISNLGFGIMKSIFKNPKSLSSIPFEFRFGTSKFEISDLENPKILIFASKF